LEKYLEKIQTWKVKELKLALSHTLVSILRNVPHPPANPNLELTGWYVTLERIYDAFAAKQKRSKDVSVCSTRA
jgi:hypothetical protein